MVLSVSFNGHLRLFNKIEAADGVGTCGFFNSDVVVVLPI